MTVVRLVTNNDEPNAPPTKPKNKQQPYQGSQVPAHHVPQEPAESEVGRPDERQNRSSLSSSLAVLVCCQTEYDMVAMFRRLCNSTSYSGVQRQGPGQVRQGLLCRCLCPYGRDSTATVERRSGSPTVRRSGTRAAAKQQQVCKGDVRPHEDIKAKMGCAVAIRRMLESGKDLSLMTIVENLVCGSLDVWW